jgi:hypothetical protein
MLPTGLNILVVDSDDRRRKTLQEGLNPYHRVSAYFSARNGKGDLPDLERYDLALVHEKEADLDDGAFMDLCYASPTACVIYTGGYQRAEHPVGALNALHVNFDEVKPHIPDGIRFLQEYGKLDMTAWVRGLQTARQNWLLKKSAGK